MWEKIAKYINFVYGSSYVNWKERFYICPKCGESVYECDVSDEEFCDYLCPFCEWTEEED